MREKMTLDAINALDRLQFEEAFRHIFEHSPWVATAAHDARPFATVAALHAAMVAAVHAAPPAARLALLRAHPELARPGPLTDASAAEQRSRGLDTLDAEAAARFAALNDAYRARFGFPFIIAVRGQRDREAIMAALQTRLGHAPAEEAAAALAEVAKIARFRLDDMVAEDRP